MALFFWRKQKAATAAAPSEPVVIAADARAAAPAAVATGNPAMHPSALLEVYALALQSKRAADPAVRPDPAQMSLLLAASSEFAQIGTVPRYTPRRPSLLPQLLEALGDEDASLRALSRIVSQDPQLTGDLLRTANSAMYRVSSTPVESVERAAAMLGTRGIRSLLSASLVHPLATSGASLGNFGNMLWDHSLYSASAAEAWAARSQDADPFTAHLLALLHGLGCVAVYRVLSDLYIAQPAVPRSSAVIASALETNAAVTAARIATSWGLSERTRQALEAQSSAAPVNDHSPLSQALQFGLLTGAATLLCKHGRLPADAALERIEAGGFSGVQVARIWDRMQRAYVTP